MKGLVLVSSVGLAAMLAAGCGSSKASVAQINGVAITEDQLQRRLAVKNRVIVTTNSGRVEAPIYESLGFQALKDIFQQEATLQVAMDEGVHPSEQELADEFEYKKKLSSRQGIDLVRDFTSKGGTLEELKRQIAVELCELKLITKGINVSQDEVQKFAKDNIKAFEQPAKYNLYIVYGNTDKTRQAVEQALTQGREFRTIALEHNDNPRARGLYRGAVPSPQLTQLIENTQPGSIVKENGKQWITIADGSIMIYVDSKVPGRKADPEDPVVLKQAERSLLVKKATHSKDILKKIVEKMRTSDYKVEGYLKSQWENYLEELKKEGEADSGAIASNTP